VADGLELQSVGGLEAKKKSVTSSSGEVMTSGCLARTMETHASTKTTTKLDGGGAMDGERAATHCFRRWI
jgi:hypothetical protein